MMKNMVILDFCRGVLGWSLKFLILSVDSIDLLRRKKGQVKREEEGDEEIQKKEVCGSKWS